MRLPYKGQLCHDGKNNSCHKQELETGKTKQKECKMNAVYDLTSSAVVRTARLDIFHTYEYS